MQININTKIFFLVLTLIAGCTETKNITENVTKKGIHIESIAIWLDFQDTLIMKDNINIFINIDSTMIKKIELKK